MPNLFSSIQLSLSKVDNLDPKLFKYIEEKEKFKDLVYTNRHIVSLRFHFAHRDCNCRNTKASKKDCTKKRQAHKVLNTSVCAKKCGFWPEHNLYVIIKITRNHLNVLYTKMLHSFLIHFTSMVYWVFCNFDILTVSWHLP